MKEVKKIKSQYRNVEMVTRFGNEHMRYPNLNNRICKKFSVKQEKSLAKLHNIEYKNEYKLKIRSKRDGAIPDPWDDYRSSAFDLATSWKHNSKRKNQFYKEN